MSGKGVVGHILHDAYSLSVADLITDRFSTGGNAIASVRLFPL